MSWLQGFKKKASALLAPSLISDRVRRPSTSSVLHYAVLSGNLSSLRLLLFAGAHVAYPSDQLNKPSCLDFAILQGNLPMIKLLIEFGAQLNTGSAIIGLPLHVVLSEKVRTPALSR